MFVNSTIVVFVALRVINSFTVIFQKPWYCPKQTGLPVVLYEDGAKMKRSRKIDSCCYIKEPKEHDVF